VQNGVHRIHVFAVQRLDLGLGDAPAGSDELGRLLRAVEPIGHVERDGDRLAVPAVEVGQRQPHRAHLVRRRYATQQRLPGNPQLDQRRVGVLGRERQRGKQERGVRPWGKGGKAHQVRPRRASRPGRIGSAAADEQADGQHDQTDEAVRRVWA
jgi:hypothetical protein